MLANGESAATSASAAADVAAGIGGSELTEQKDEKTTPEAKLGDKRQADTQLDRNASSGEETADSEPSLGDIGIEDSIYLAQAHGVPVKFGDRKDTKNNSASSKDSKGTASGSEGKSHVITFKIPESLVEDVEKADDSSPPAPPGAALNSLSPPGNPGFRMISKKDSGHSAVIGDVAKQQTVNLTREKKLKPKKIKKEPPTETNFQPMATTHPSTEQRRIQFADQVEGRELCKVTFTNVHYPIEMDDEQYTQNIAPVKCCNITCVVS